MIQKRFKNVGEVAATPSFVDSFSLSIFTLSEQASLSGATEVDWSAQIQQRYQCRLSDQIADWFDSEIWKQESGNEYCLAATPQELLAETPEIIWPGLMPCNFLPLIGSGGGDWLCIRLDEDGAARKIVQWYHGGGDWIPWGNELAEALLFDAVRNRLPGPKRGHAVPAIEHSATDDLANDPYIVWARKHLPPDLVTLADSNADAKSLAHGLINHHVAEVAVRCVLLEAALSEPFTGVLNAEVAANLQLPWNDVIEWTFDTGRMPSSVSTSLSQKFAMNSEPAQDWDRAASLCKEVTEIAPTLAWAWDVLGYCNEREGKNAEAIKCYKSGAGSSVFTDQSVRLRTHWMLNHAPKFSLARLIECSQQSIDADDYLSVMCGKDSNECRKAVTQYWLNAADEAAESADFSTQYDCLLKAGWDLGAEPMSAFVEIISKISEAAFNAGSNALGELAKTHVTCLKQRYRF